MERILAHRLPTRIETMRITRVSWGVVLLIINNLAHGLSSHTLDSKDSWYIITAANDFDNVIGVYHVAQKTDDTGVREIHIETRIRLSMLFINIDIDSKMTLEFSGGVLQHLTGNIRRSGDHTTIEAHERQGRFHLSVIHNGESRSSTYRRDAFRHVEQELMLAMPNEFLTSTDTIEFPVLYPEQHEIHRVTLRRRGRKQVTVMGRSELVHQFVRKNRTEDQTLWVDDNGEIILQQGKRAALVRSSADKVALWRARQ